MHNTLSFIFDLAYIGENGRNVYKILFGKLIGKRLLGRTLRETGCEDCE